MNERSAAARRAR